MKNATMANAPRDFYYCFLLHHLPRVRDGFIWSILDRNRDLGRSLEEFFALPAEAYRHDYQLPAEAARALKDSAWKERADTSFELCRRAGVRIVTVLESDYPQNIREYYEKPPPVLYLYGNAGLLDTKKVAILSSRAAGGATLEEINRFSDAAADAGATLVSSPSRVVYNIVALKAKVRQAPQIVAADRGLLQVFGKDWGRDPVPLARRLDRALDLDRTLVISPFSLDDVGTRGSAILRDRLVVAMADIALGLSIRAGGNLHKELERALKRGKPVVAVKGLETPRGNLALLLAGAEPIAPDETLLGWRQAITGDRSLQAPMPASAPTCAAILIQRMVGSATKGALRRARLVDIHCGAGKILEAAVRGGCPPAQALGLSITDAFKQEWIKNKVLADCPTYVAEPLIDQPALGAEAGSFDMAVSDLTGLSGAAPNWVSDLMDAGQGANGLTAKHGTRFPATASGFRRQAALKVANAIRETYTIWKLKAFDVPERVEEEAAAYMPGIAAPEPRPTKQLYDKEFERLQRMDWNRFQAQPEGARGFVKRLGRVPQALLYVERAVQLAKPGGLVMVCLPELSAWAEIADWIQQRTRIISDTRSGPVRHLVLKKH
ncbi:MAG: DNA-processing protein DprA [bacterium]